MSELTNKNVIASFTIGGNLINTNSVTWSLDNYIAIIFSKGVYILNTDSNPSINSSIISYYHKSAIENQNETMKFDVGIDVDALLKSSKLDEQQLLILDHTLMSNTSNALPFRGYRSAEWSPQIKEYGCLLALLTLDHRLLVYKRNEQHSWVNLLDLSTLLNKDFKKCYDHVGESNYSTYKQRIYDLAIVSICWGQKYTLNTKNDKSENCFLYSASKSGLITFWKFNFHHKINVEVDYKWQTKLGQIVAMKLHQKYLITTFINGIVLMICTEFNAKEEPVPFYLWSEQDELPVYFFDIKKSDKEDIFDVILLKGLFIIFCRVEKQKIKNNMTMVLKFCKYEQGLNQMPASGLCEISDNRFLSSSLDGKLTEITISQDFNINKKDVSLDLFRKKGMVTFGLSSSRNNVLFCIAQMLSVYHDHLAIREPIQVFIVSNLSYEDLILFFQQEFAKKSSQFKNMIECQDYLDCFKYYCGLNQNNSLTETFLNKILNEDFKKFDEIKLKLIRFILKIFDNDCSLKNIQIDQTTVKEKLTLCEDLILKSHIENIFSNLVPNKINTLLNDQQLSLQIMKNWMKQKFNKTFPKFNLKTSSETCPLCDSVMNGDDKNIANCVNNHSFLRCSNSLLLCDIVNHKYEKCIRCLASLIIKPPIWNSNSICLYCE